MRALVLLWVCLALRASASLSGPKDVSGFEGDTVTLRCTYAEEHRAHTKYWCREVGLLISRCSTKVFVGKDRQEATEGRVSIRDSPQELVLTVTLRDLVKKDAGEYWCGVQQLGPDEVFKVSLTVFPGAERPGATTRASPAPSFWPPLATTASLRPRAGAQTPQPPAPTSPDQRPTDATTQQGHGGAEASPHTETATSRHTTTSRHRATSPPAGSSRPATVPDTSSSSTAGDPGVSRSLSSMSSVPIPTARLLAPVLVLVSLLLAAGLIALGAHLLRGRKSALLASGTQRDEKARLPAMPLVNSWVHEGAMLTPPGHPEPLASPFPGSAMEIRRLSQAEEQEETPSQGPEAESAPAQ